MLEPSNPVTLKTRYTPYPAVELQSDEGRALRPGSIILRHRHLKQQFTIVPSARCVATRTVRNDLADFPYVADRGPVRSPRRGAPTNRLQVP